MMIQITFIAFGLALITAAVVGLQLPRHESWWKPIPRARRAGAAAGVLALMWAASLTAPLLAGLFGGTPAKFEGMLPIIVIVAAIGCFFLMDYLFARAVGGLLLLSVNTLLQYTFAIGLQVPLRIMVALICYTLGTYALFMLGSPYRFRNLLERMTHKASWRLPISGALAVSGILICSICAISPG